MDWIVASAGVRQGHPAPEERSRERPLAWKVVQHAVVAVAAAVTAAAVAAAAVAAAPVAAAMAAVAVRPAAAALWHHGDWMKKRCPEL